MTRFALQIFCYLLFISFITASATAQERGSLSGVARDPSGAVVTNARVVLTKTSIGFERLTVSDEQGHFRFDSLDPGAYQLTADAPNLDSVALDVAVGCGISVQDIQFRFASPVEKVLVVARAFDALIPDPNQRTFLRDQVLEANPGRPGSPISIPGLPVETASSGIKAPQYFAPGVAGDHGEPIAQFFQVGNFLFPNNLPANAHGNGYADPNVLIASTIASVSTDGGAFNVREGNHAVDLSITYGFLDRLVPFAEVTADPHDADFVTGWSPKNGSTLGWLALEVSFGNGFLARPEHRQEYKLNGHRSITFGEHTFTLFAAGYYGSSFIPGLIPINMKIRGDTIDSRQQDRTRNSLIVVTDAWHLAEKQQLEFSGFFRTYALDLRSNFGAGLIRQSESRAVIGGSASYLFSTSRLFSVIAGIDLRRDAPRNLYLDRATQGGVFQQVTSNDLTLQSADPFVSIDGALSRLFHYDVGVRREEVSTTNADNIVPGNSFSKIGGITLPKGTFTILAPKRYLPEIAFSFGKAFHTNDPRIAAAGAGTTPTIIVPSRGMQLVVRKQVARTDLSVTLARVSNAEELAKIDPDTGLQENIGPSIRRSLTISARRYFSIGSLQASWARANARDRITGENVPEAPRLIWDIAGTLDRLPFGFRARSEFENVGRKPLDQGFTAIPVREFRLAVSHSFHRRQIDVGVNALIPHGYTGQTLEAIRLSCETSRTNRVVGVPLKPYFVLSWAYTFKPER
jgi:hypothetical protein